MGGGEFQTVLLALVPGGVLATSAENRGVVADGVGRPSVGRGGIGRELGGGRHGVRVVVVRCPAGGRHPYLRPRENRVFLQRPGRRAGHGGGGRHRLARGRPFLHAAAAG